MAANKTNEKAAFMLLEVLLSIFIVTVGIVFVISSFITAIKAFKVSKSYLVALLLAENRMWEYNESGKIEEGSYSGKFEDFDAEWDIEAREIEDLPLNEVSLEVALKEDDDRRRKFTIATYLRKKE